MDIDRFEDSSFIFSVREQIKQHIPNWYVQYDTDEHLWRAVYQKPGNFHYTVTNIVIEVSGYDVAVDTLIRSAKAYEDLISESESKEK